MHCGHCKQGHLHSDATYSITRGIMDGSAPTRATLLATGFASAVAAGALLGYWFGSESPRSGKRSDGPAIESGTSAAAAVTAAAVAAASSPTAAIVSTLHELPALWAASAISGAPRPLSLADFARAIARSPDEPALFAELCARFGLTYSTCAAARLALDDLVSAASRAAAAPSSFTLTGMSGPEQMSVGTGTALMRMSSTIPDLYMLKVPSLRELNPEADARLPNTVDNTCRADGHDVRGMDHFSGFITYTSDTSFVVAQVVRREGDGATSTIAYQRAGPRALLYFRPSEVRAAIITCGGLCPGLNNVIKDVVETLRSTYGVRFIIGLRNGFWGFHGEEEPSTAIS